MHFRNSEATAAIKLPLCITEELSKHTTHTQKGACRALAPAEQTHSHYFSYVCVTITDSF